MGCGSSTQLGKSLSIVLNSYEVKSTGSVGVAEQKGFEPLQRIVDQPDFDKESRHHAHMCSVSMDSESARRVDCAADSARDRGPDEMTNISTFSAEDCEAGILDSGNLLQSLGGHESLVYIIDLFYEKVLSDHRLSGFFQDCNVELLKSHVVAFVSLMLDGSPNHHESFNVESMALAHGHLIQNSGLNDVHFDKFVGHLEATFLNLKVASLMCEGERVCSEIMRMLRPLRRAFQVSSWEGSHSSSDIIGSAAGTTFFAARNDTFLT
jgi:hemoglobin